MIHLDTVVVYSVMRLAEWQCDMKAVWIWSGETDAGFEDGK